MSGILAMPDELTSNQKKRRVGQGSAVYRLSMPPGEHSSNVIQSRMDQLLNEVNNA